MYKVLIHDVKDGWVPVGGPSHKTYDSAYQHMSKCKVAWPDEQFDISYIPNKKKGK